MNEKIFKGLAGIFIFLIAISFFWPGGGEKNYNVNVQTMVYAGDGLDLATIGTLLKKAKNAEDLEKLLNDPATGVNNLDLNEDGKVDYIKVTEYGSDQDNNNGFSLTVEPAPGEVQEIATIDIAKSGDKAEVEVRGNEQIYGQNHYYHSSFGITDMLFMYWLFRPHPMYMSPWGYGHYPGSYRPYSTVSHNEYRNRTAGKRDLKRASNSRIKNKATSPNAGKSAARGIKAPLKKPTRSQRSFQKRNPSKQMSRGAFGRNSRPSRPSVRRSSGFGRSGGRFGGK